MYPLASTSSCVMPAYLTGWGSDIRFLCCKEPEALFPVLPEACITPGTQVWCFCLLQSYAQSTVGHQDRLWGLDLTSVS